MSSDDIAIPSVGLTVEQRAAFLDAIQADRSLGNAAALRSIGVPGTKGELKALIDPELAEEARAARGYGNTAIRNEIARRAIHGVDKPVYWQGEQVGVVREYSDRLLALMAKAHLPEYRDTSDVSVQVAAQMNVQIEDRSATLNAVAEVLRAVGALPDSSTAALPALPAAGEILAAAPDG